MTAMVYDERRRRVVVVTGTGTVAEWDGSSWTLPVSAGAAGCSASAPELFGGHLRSPARAGRCAQGSGFIRRYAAVLDLGRIEARRRHAAVVHRQGVAGSALVYDLARGNLQVIGMSSTSTTVGDFMHVWEGALP